MINNLEIIEIIGDFISALMLIYFFNRVMITKNKKYSKVYTVLMIMFYAFIPVNDINRNVPNLIGYKIFLFIIIYEAIVLIYPVLFKKGRISEKFFLTQFYISMMLGSSFIIYSMFSMFFNTTFMDILLNIGYERSIAMLVNRFIQFILIIIFLNNIDNISFIKYIKDKTLYIGGIVLILNHILVFLIEMDILKKLYKINSNVIVMVLILCIIQVLSIYMLNALAKEIEEKFVLKMDLNRKIHDEEVIDMYTKIIGWKHDLKNHINMIWGLLEVSTKEDVISYVKEIDESISELDKNIYTENMAINSILISKMKYAEQECINVNLDLKIDSEINISNVDICVVLGNLLDNSIEACRSIEGYRHIDLIIVSQNNKLVIKISNNTNGYVNKVKDKFLTTKRNAMNGIGLTQVDNIVKKYNGYINRKHENNIFTTYMMIQY